MNFLRITLHGFHYFLHVKKESVIKILLKLCEFFLVMQNMCKNLFDLSSLHSLLPLFFSPICMVEMEKKVQ